MNSQVVFELYSRFGIPVFNESLGLIYHHEKPDLAFREDMFFTNFIEGDEIWVGDHLHFFPSPITLDLGKALYDSKN